MTSLPIYQVDAFVTNEPFSGNPAAVCPLETWLPAEVMQGIALENNLSETAFFVPRDDGEFDLRWFTPWVEVDLCGHATLGSAYVLFFELGFTGHEIGFHTRSGRLAVTRRGDDLVLAFPKAPPERVANPPSALTEALNHTPKAYYQSFESAGHGNYMVVFDSQAEVEKLAPDFHRLRTIEGFGVIATAPGEHTDFVSRYFAAPFGIDEDPATGSTHCMLAPYWADQFDRNHLTAKQISTRGGALTCSVTEQQVEIAGTARRYLKGTIHLPTAG